MAKVVRLKDDTIAEILSRSSLDKSSKIDLHLRMLLGLPEYKRKRVLSKYDISYLEVGDVTMFNWPQDREYSGDPYSRALRVSIARQQKELKELGRVFKFVSIEKGLCVKRMK